MGGIWIRPGYEAAGVVFLEHRPEPEEVAESSVDFEAERTGRHFERGVLLRKEPFVYGPRTALGSHTWI